VDGGLIAIIVVVAIVAIAYGVWRRHRSGGRCPIDGGPRCPHCKIDEQEEGRASK